MAKVSNALFLIILGAHYLLSVGGADADSVPDDLRNLNQPEPQIELIHPYFKIQGKSVQSVQFSLDSDWTDKRCSAEDRNGEQQRCLQPFTIDPGPHILSVVFCEKLDCSKSGAAWHAELRFNVGLRESVTIDLKALAEEEDPEKSPKVIQRRHRKKPKISACGSALESTFHINTCNSKGAGEFASALKKIAKTCEKDWKGVTDRLFEFATWQFAWLSPSRCYKSDEIQKLPEFLIERVGSGFWPSGTIEGGQSSWSWARGTYSYDASERLRGAKLRARVFKDLSLWTERQKVVDQLIGAVLDPEKQLKPLVDDAAANRSEMNPALPAGHRIFALSHLASSVPRIGNDKSVKLLLAKSVQSQDAIHCGLRPEASQIIRAMIKDQDISRTDWDAIKLLITRTPKDRSMSDCGSAIHQQITQGVALEERARFFAQADCHALRDQSVRGKTISMLVQSDSAALPSRLRIKLMKEFPDCIR